jgi:hypothetical protein
MSRAAASRQGRCCRSSPRIWPRRTAATTRPLSAASPRRSHLAAGADHVTVQVLTGNGNDPIPAYRQLARVLL